MNPTKIISHLLQYKLHIHTKNREIHMSIDNKNMKLKAIISLNKTITIKLQLPDHMFNQVLSIVSSQIKKYALNSKPT